MNDTSAYLFVRPECTLQFDGQTMVLQPGKTLVCKGETTLTLRRRAFSALSKMPGCMAVFCLVRPPYELIDHPAVVNGEPRGQYVKGTTVFIQGIEDATKTLHRFAHWVATQGFEQAQAVLSFESKKALGNCLAVKKRMTENRCTPEDEVVAREAAEGQVAQAAYRLKEVSDLILELEATTWQAVSSTILQSLNRCPEDAARGTMQEGTRAMACIMALREAQDMRLAMTDDAYAAEGTRATIGQAVSAVATDAASKAHVVYNQRLEAMLAQLMLEVPR